MQSCKEKEKKHLLTLYSLRYKTNMREAYILKQVPKDHDHLLCPLFKCLSLQVFVLCYEPLQTVILFSFLHV